MLFDIEEFATYVTYTRRLGFEDNPDYDYLRGLFTKVLVKINEPEDGIFDWMLLEQSKYDFKVSKPLFLINIHNMTC